MNDAKDTIPTGKVQLLHQQLLGQFHSKKSSVVPADPKEWTLPDLLHSHGEGLSQVPSSTLERCVQPVLEGLKSLDAESLLELERASSENGAVVGKGIYCKPIHPKIHPPCSDETVRYLHLSDQPGQYSMGIFIFPPNSTIPLHDHPGMCVLSRLLYGTLHRQSLDLAREKDETEDDEAEEGSAMDVDSKQPSQKGEQENRPSFLTSPWRISWRSNKAPKKKGSVPKLPEGSRRAFKNQVDHLEAPDCAVLYPFEGNLHEFMAGPRGAAVLDVLFPPYDDHDRDCTFYDIQPDDQPEKSSAGHLPNQEPCIVIPTGQPESFHCLSGQYRTLGTAD